MDGGLMNFNYSGLLFVAIIMETEYGLKPLLEVLSRRHITHVRSYCLYRLVHLVVLTILLGVLFRSSYPWYSWLIVSFAGIIIGSLELVVDHIKCKNNIFKFAPFILIVYYSVIVLRLINGEAGPFLQQFTAMGLAVGASAILLSHPVNYLIKLLINPKESKALCKKNERSCIVNAGRTIGILERWLIMILMMSGQYGSIGFVLTAKSIARFKNFEKEDFAEYYLVGTLYSVLFAVVISLLFLNVR
jgi:hypothetical protein